MTSPTDHNQAGSRMNRMGRRTADAVLVNLYAGDRLAGTGIAVARLIASQRVRSAYGRGFILIAKLLLSQVPKFLFPIFRTTGFLPKLIRSCLGFLFARFGHHFSPSWSTAPPSGLEPYRQDRARPAWRLASGFKST